MLVSLLLPLQHKLSSSEPCTCRKSGPAVAIVQHNTTLRRHIESAHEVNGQLRLWLRFLHGWDRGPTIGGVSLTNLRVNFRTLANRPRRLLKMPMKRFRGHLMVIYESYHQPNESFGIQTKLFVKQRWIGLSRPIRYVFLAQTHAI